MGVKDLWTIASPVGEVEVLSSLSGQILAIDLSCWICDSQKAKMGGAIIKPHLRNLFFRTTTLLSNGIIPVFVIEGEAPKLKLKTMQKRNNNQFTQSKASGKRTRLKGFLSQCCEMLDLLGIPWIQATGEGEATCAALNYFGVVDCVVTQDSDVFLYGGKCVLRNFSANKQKGTFDKFTLEKLETVFGLSRDMMIVMAILLGCDYLPGGVTGIGKEGFLQLVQYWRTIKVTDPIKRLREWKMESSEDKYIKNVEDSIRSKVTVHPNFPFTDIFEEFQQEMQRPHVKVKWEEPKLLQLVRFLMNMLNWEASYCIEKCAPILTLWMLNNGRQLPNLQVERIVKKRVYQGLPSLEVQWNLLDDFTQLGLQHIHPIKTIESTDKFTRLYPDEFSKFEDQILHAKETKKTNKSKTNRKPVAIYLQHETSSDPFDDDSIDDHDLSSIIDRLVNLKMADKSEKKEQEIICISDDESDYPERQKCDGAELITTSQDLLAGIERPRSCNYINSNSYNSLNDMRVDTVDKLPLNYSDYNLFEFEENFEVECEGLLNKEDRAESSTEFLTNNVDISAKPTFKLFDSPSFLSSSYIQNQETTEQVTPKKTLHMQDSSTFDSPEVLPLMQRLRQKYGTNLGKSVNKFLLDK